MKLAVLSDIHSNHTALARVLACAEGEGVDGFVFLGDYISDFPHPERTMDMLYALRNRYPTWFVRGNRDEYILDHSLGRSPGWEYGSSSGSLLYTYETLRSSDFAFFAGLRHVLEVRPEGCAPFTICHGSPFQTRELICHDDARMRECLNAISTSRLFLGHAHIIKCFRDGSRTAHFVGSVGLPVGYGGMTQFAMIEDNADHWEIRHVMIPYDVESALAEFEPSGLSAKAGLWARAVAVLARTGFNMPDELARKARALAKSEVLEAALNEAHYIRAAKELGIS